MILFDCILGTDTVDSPKAAVEVGVILKSASPAGVAGTGSLSKQAFGVLESLEQDIAVHAGADAAAEEMGKMVLAHVKTLRHRVKCQFLPIVVAEVSQHLCDQRQLFLRMRF